MRIHSKFKDYYDTALGYGIDEDIHYVRERQEFESSPKKRVLGDSLYLYANSCRLDTWRFKEEYRRGSNEVTMSIGNILFCGKLYSYVFAQEGYSDPIYIWDYDTFISFYKNHMRDEFIGKLPNKFLTDMKNLFVPTEHKRFADIHHDTGVPIIHCCAKIYRYNNEFHTADVIYNECLKDVAFYKVMDPFTAFQELSMFIGGVLGGNSPKMVTISDAMKVYKHGFDPKYGFRTRKKE